MENTFAIDLVFAPFSFIPAAFPTAPVEGKNTISMQLVVFKASFISVSVIKTHGTVAVFAVAFNAFAGMQG
jgi:hypothetical protein